MNIVVLAGGIGAGKFLRGLTRVVEPSDITVVVNTGDDMTLHGLHISPDIDSVMYWLAGISDRERGWGRADETFRTLEEVRGLGGEAWFALGDLDMATHLVRTEILSQGRPLSDATRQLAAALGIVPTVLPMTDDPVATMIHAVDEHGQALYMHFQVYWVQRGARDEVKGVRYEAAGESSPAPGVVESIEAADAVLVAPSNPVVSIGPILAVPGIPEGLQRPGLRVVGISPIVAGAPLRGMADRLMPAVGLEVSAFGAASSYRDVLDGWVIDERDRVLSGRIEEELGIRTAVTDTIMADDAAAERVARSALDLTRP